LAEGGAAAFSARAEEPVKQSSVPRLPLPLDPSAPDAALMDQVIDYYHERLWKTPAALDYLRSRGLYHACPADGGEEAFRTFRLGFADRTLGLRLPGANRKEGAALRDRLQGLGILRESGHEHLSGCVVLPIPNAHGRPARLYGRRVGKPNPGALKHLFLPGPHEGIWNVEALDAGEVILCEAPFDALTFWVNGFKNVTFIYGTEGFLDLPKQGQSAIASGEGGTDTHMGLILKNKIRRVYIAYDADESGNRAAARDAERLTAHGVEVFRVKFPWGMDANEYAQKVTPADKSLAVLLNAAEWQGGSSPTRAPAPSSLKSLAAKFPPKADPPITLAEAADEKTTAKNEVAVNPVNPVNPAVPAVASCEGRVQNSVPESPCLERQGEYHLLKLGPREYRVGGLDKNNSLEVMKVAIRIRHGENFHLDSFDLARDGERRRFIERAAEETRLEKELKTIKEPAHIDRTARKDLGMKRPDELEYRFAPPSEKDK